MTVDYIRGELSPEDKQKLETHLANCPECAEQFEGAKRVMEVAEEAAEPAVVELLDKVVKEAAEQGASDIHAEPSDEGMLIRLRVDGLMREYGRYPAAYLEPFCARVKYVAEGDFESARELSQPWTGRIRDFHEPEKLDLRCSYIPTVRGPSMVIRILRRTATVQRLDDLGFGDQDLQRVREFALLPYGIVIITGPGGHGRTTLAYSMLTERDPEKQKVLTIEDPVELVLPHVIQTRVKPKEGLTFHDLLRHLMRQDPDAIMCSDVPNRRTSGELVHAALTGHFVLTILPEPDALSAVRRFVDRTDDPDPAAGMLRGVIATRLARKVCEACAESYAPTESELSLLSRALGKQAPAAAKLRRGKGCEECRQMGYSGLTGVYEVFTVSDKLADLIRSEAEDDDLLAAATEVGYTSLRQACARKVLAGETTIDELRRVT